MKKHIALAETGSYMGIEFQSFLGSVCKEISDGKEIKEHRAYLRSGDGGVTWFWAPVLDPVTWIACHEGAEREADCEACIERYETAPQPITTADLAEVVDLIQRLAVARHDNVSREALELCRRLRRPRKARP